MEEIKDLWAAYSRLKFPGGYEPGSELQDLHADLVCADTFASGYVHTFIKGQGRLGAEGTEELEHWIDELRRLSDAFGDKYPHHPEFKTYTTHLLVLSEKVLSVGRQ